MSWFARCRRLCEPRAVIDEPKSRGDASARIAALPHSTSSPATTSVARGPAAGAARAEEAPHKASGSTVTDLARPLRSPAGAAAIASAHDVVRRAPRGAPARTTTKKHV